MATFKLAIHGQEQTFEASRQGNELHISGEAGQTAVYRIVQQAGTAVWLEQLHPDGRRQQWQLRGHKEGDKRQIWTNGRFLQANRVRQQGKSSQTDASLSAAIPAVVSDILVQVGNVVSEGDKLILLESMKMVIPIQAPYAGTVTAVHCQKGESVQAGIPLIEIETPSET